MDQLKLNAADWESISDEQRNHITDILRTTGVLDKNTEIVADKNAPGTKAANLAADATEDFAAGVWCKLACNVGEAAAVAACGTLPPPANAICIAAAHAAGELCRGKC